EPAVSRLGTHHGCPMVPRTTLEQLISVGAQVRIDAATRTGVRYPAACRVRSTARSPGERPEGAAGGRIRPAGVGKPSSASSRRATVDGAEARVLAWSEPEPTFA